MNLEIIVYSKIFVEQIETKRNNNSIAFFKLIGNNDNKLTLKIQY